MADDTNEDSWLYGTSNPDSTTNEDERKEPDTQAEDAGKEDENEASQNANDHENEGTDLPDTNTTGKSKGEGVDDPANEMEEQEHDDGNEENEKEQGESDLDDSDDDINVVIGDIKSGPTASYNIKQRANLIAPSAAISQEKPKPSAGKFNIEEFESVGTINGVPAHEFSIDSLDEKPWRKPGADITDYFNYGFNEDTWRSYCERQKRFRINESGVGLQGLAAGNVNIITQASVNNRTLTPLTNNENSKYAGQLGPPRRPGPPAENVIQVMTAERREYSRPGGTPFGEPYFDQDAYNYGYEPTQDSQWMNDNSAGWAPTGIKELTPGPQMVPPPPMGGMVPPPHMGMRVPMPMPQMVGMPPHMGGVNMMPPNRMIPNNPPPNDRERDRDRERHERERERDRTREREREKEKERELDWDLDEDHQRVDRERTRREHERHRERGKSEESERPATNESPSRDRERRRSDRRERDRERESRSKRSRSREGRSRRRSRSREKDRDRKSRDKKKHRKDKEDSE